MTYTPAPATRRGAHLLAVRCRAHGPIRIPFAPSARVPTSPTARSDTVSEGQVQQSGRRRRIAYHNSSTVSSTMHGHHTISVHGDRHAAACGSAASPKRRRNAATRVEGRTDAAPALKDTVRMGTNLSR